jgi:SLIT-ROBO Rho GTPase activating protein
MMDPYNLAICFGPTLVPIPTDRDQVQFQNLVNELIKNFIIFHEDIFPNDGQGVVYEKYISSEPEDVQEYGNDDITATEEDFESEVTEDGKLVKKICYCKVSVWFNSFYDDIQRPVR